MNSKAKFIVFILVFLGAFSIFVAGVRLYNDNKTQEEQLPILEPKGLPYHISYKIRG